MVFTEGDQPGQNYFDFQAYLAQPLPAEVAGYQQTIDFGVNNFNNFFKFIIPDVVDALIDKGIFKATVRGNYGRDMSMREYYDIAYAPQDEEGAAMKRACQLFRELQQKHPEVYEYMLQTYIADAIVGATKVFTWPDMDLVITGRERLLEDSYREEMIARAEALSEEEREGIYYRSVWSEAFFYEKIKNQLAKEGIDPLILKG